MNSTSRGSRLVERRQVARRAPAPAGRLAQVDAHLVRDDVRQRGLAQARRPEQQHMVERFVALLRRRDEDRQLLADFLLPDVFVEAARAQRSLDDLFLRARGFGVTMRLRWSVSMAMERILALAAARLRRCGGGGFDRARRCRQRRRTYSVLSTSAMSLAVRSTCARETRLVPGAARGRLSRPRDRRRRQPEVREDVAAARLQRDRAGTSQTT